VSRARIADWLPVAAVLVVLAVGVAYAGATGLLQEDALITLRYARNLGEGHAFVFNPGERVLGTTAPLLALLLAPVPSDWLPAAATVLGILAAGAVTALQFRLCRRLGVPDAVPLGAALFTALSYELVAASVSGMESMLVVALMFAALAEVADDRPAGAGVALALLLLARIDGALWVLLVVAYAWASGRPLRRMLLALGLGLLPWTVFATLYFGSPLPHTLMAKWVSYQPPGFAARWAVLWGWLHPLEPQAWPLSRGLDLLFVLGAVAALRGQRALAVPALAAPGQVLALALFAPVTAPWYVVPAGVCFALVCALGAEVVVRWGLRGRWPWRLAVPAGLGLVALVAEAQRTVASLDLSRRAMENEHGISRAAGLWLRAHSAPDARVLAEPLGFIGFYSRRYLWDMVGLVSPTITEYRRTFPGNRWFWESLRDLAPDLVVLRGFERPQNRMFLHGGSLLPPEGLAWFDERYRLEAVFESPHRPPDANSLAIYRRVTPVAQKNDAKN